MLTLIIGRGKSGKTNMLLEQVKACEKNGMAQRIVIVPEQLSHTTERRLSQMCGDEISYVSEVLSFTRLYNRVCSISGGGARKVLDGTGRILTAKLALDSIRHRLKVFASASGRGEFLSGMVSMIDELKSYEITPEILSDTAKKTTGMFSEKLSELSLILGAYNAAMANGSFDPRDNLTLLVGKLQEGGYARQRSFFVDGFTDFSTQEMHVLRQLLLDSGDMTVTVPCDDIMGTDMLFSPGRQTAQALLQMAQLCGQETRILTASYKRPLPEALTYLEERFLDYRAVPFEGCAGEITISEFSERLAECRRCGGILKKHAMEGMRYRDMTVAACDEKAYGGLLETVLRSMDIPMYRAEKKSLLGHPAAAFVLLAVEAAVDHLETETVTAYLKTGYSGVSGDECDAIENYAVVWRIRGSKWQSPWRMHPDGYDGRMTPEVEEELEQLNEKKDRAVLPLVHLRNRLRSGENAAAQVKAIYNFLEETHLYDTLIDEVSRDTELGRQEQAQETAQIYGILLECLKQVHGVLGKTAPKTEELLRVLRLALSQYQIGTIPAVLDAVPYGSIEQVRGQEPKILYVLGANEGAMPGAVSGGSLLSERERVVLRDEFQITLAPDSEKNMERQNLGIYSALTAPTEKLYLSFSNQNGDAQPSFLLERIMKLFPERGTPTPQETEYTLSGAAEDYLICENPALTEAIGMAAKELTALAQEIVTCQQGALPRNERITTNSAKALFGSPVALTASRLDQLGKCPLSFFLNYGVKAKRRKEASFDALEFGNFIHFVLEKTVKELAEKGKITPIELSESAQMVERYLAVYAKDRFAPEAQSSRERYLFNRNGQEATILLQEISQELGVSDFQPRKFELEFGGKGEMPAVTVSGTLGKGKLTGFVDRADIWETEDADYLRVVDYKSGTKTFDYTEIYNGIGMQMLLYLFAMEQGADKKTIPAGVLYMPAKRTFESGDPDTEPEVTKRSGLILGENQVLEAMEHGDTHQYLPVPKRGKMNYVISRSQMDALKEFTTKKMAKAVDDILGGDFSPRPFYRGSNSDPCSNCAYVEVCQRDPKFRQKHYHEKIEPGVFWEQVGGEADG